MKNLLPFLTIIGLALLVSCSDTGGSKENLQDTVKQAVTVENTINNANTGEYLLHVAGENGSKYVDKNGKTVIPEGKYVMCFTDTFSTFAIVLHPEQGFIAIDRQEKTLYNVFQYDNGPDYPAEGLFRIEKDKKMGYADAKTGQILIAPQYAAAFPFQDGKAEVTMSCKVIQDGENTMWDSDEWFTINTKGEKVK